MKREVLLARLQAIRANSSTVSDLYDEIVKLEDELINEAIRLAERKNGIADLSRCANSIINQYKKGQERFESMCGTFIYEYQYICGCYSVVRIKNYTRIPCEKTLQEPNNAVINLFNRDFVSCQTICLPSVPEIEIFIKTERAQHNLSRNESIHFRLDDWYSLDARYLLDIVKLLGSDIKVYDVGQEIYLESERGDAILCKVRNKENLT